MRIIDFNRFKALVQWTFTTDRRAYAKMGLTWVVMLTLMFLFFTCVVNFDNDVDGVKPYQPCGFAVLCMLAVIVVMGPAFMFNSLKGKHDDQVLLMLPASNVEKYVVRYLSWVVMLVLCVAALVVADGVQYVVNLLAGHDPMLVTQWLAEMPNRLHRVLGPVPSGLRHLLVALTMFFLWIHSLYAVGATLFRSHKHNSVLTTLVLIVGFVLLLVVAGQWGYVNAFWWNYVGYFNLLFLVLTLINFLLSFWLFCRMQVKGKFINI